MRSSRLATRFAGLGFAGAVALAVSCASPPQTFGQAATDGCRVGELARDGLRWDVRLRVPAGAGSSSATLGVDALWIADRPLPSFRVRNGVVAFDLPWSMGAFRGRLENAVLAGEVTFADGRVAPLEIAPDACPVGRAIDLRWTSGDVGIAGTLALPPGPGPFPVVAVVHGGGDSSRESPAYSFWGDYLPRHGFAALLYDKRGNGASSGDWHQVGFEARARDVAAGLALVRERDDVDGGRTGLLAVSQGSWVAGLVAELDPGVAFVAHVSGPAVSVLDADTYAVESRLRRQRWDDRSTAERLRLWKLNARMARNPSDSAWNLLQAAIDDVRHRPWFQREPYKPERVSEWRGWYGRVLDHDPRPILEGLDIPMLWIYGAMDGQSDPARNVRVLEGYRRRGKEYTIAVYPEAGHGVLVPVRPDGEQGRYLTTAPGFFPDLIRWLRARAHAVDP